MEQFVHIVQKQGGSLKAEKLLPEHGLNIGAAAECELRVESLKQARRFYVRASTMGVFLKDFTAPRLNDRPLFLSRKYQFSVGGSVFFLILWKAASPPPPEVIASPEVEDLEGGGEAMPTDPRSSDRFTIDLSLVAKCKLGEVFGTQDLDPATLDERLWQFLRDHSSVDVREPEGGDNLEWLAPMKVSDADLDATSEAFAAGDYSFDDLRKQAVEIGTLKDVALADVFGTGHVSGSALYEKLWSFLRARGLLR